MSDTLECQARNASGTREARRLRKKGLVPAILYGHGEACVPLVATREAVEAVVRHGSRIVELSGAAKGSALVKQLQWDAFGVRPLHVDLLRVSARDRVHVKVPVDLKGECPGQRAGGVVSLLLHEVEIECTADSIPERLHAVISALEVGGTVKVKDLELPPGGRSLVDGEEIVVNCTRPGEKAAAEEAGGAEPEVIGRKAAEEEGESEES
jgi:large subunit ribosomal protein L25